MAGNDRLDRIDERLDRLTERHEALTHTVELLAGMHQDLVSKHQDLASKHLDLARMQQKNEALMAQVLEAINSLARIAQAHERRLEDLESHR